MSLYSIYVITQRERERERDLLGRDRMAEGHVFKGHIAVCSAAGYVGAD